MNQDEGEPVRYLSVMILLLGEVHTYFTNVCFGGLKVRVL